MILGAIIHLRSIPRSNRNPCVCSTWATTAVSPGTIAQTAHVFAYAYNSMTPAVEETGSVPPGNVRGESAWTRRARAAKPEIKLTPGKGAADLTVPLEDIIDAVVKQNRVRAAAGPGQ